MSLIINNPQFKYQLAILIIFNQKNMETTLLNISLEKRKIKPLNLSFLKHQKLPKQSSVKIITTKASQLTDSTQHGFTQRTSQKTTQITSERTLSSNSNYLRKPSGKNKFFELKSKGQKDQLKNSAVVQFKNKVKIAKKVTESTKLKNLQEDLFYKWSKSEILDNRYELLELIGKGSFGQVIKAFDTKQKQLVAVKIIKNQKQYTSFAKQQINFLILLRQNNKKAQKTIVKIKNFFKLKDHICIVFELLSVNLRQFLESIHFCGLSLDVVRRIAIQLFSSLIHLKENKIIHADIKLENIVFKQPFKTGIKLIDFGTSIMNNQKFFDYITTRHYRAPQIILGHQFDESIDMWSAGCVLIELYFGNILFPGQNEKQQLYLMIECLGLPPSHYLNKCKRKSVYFKNDQQLIQELIINHKKVSPGSRSLEKLIPNTTFCNFMKKILTWEDHKRLNPYEALLDPWILQGLPEQILKEHRRQIQNDLLRYQKQKINQINHHRNRSNCNKSSLRKSIKKQSKKIYQ